MLLKSSSILLLVSILVVANHPEWARGSLPIKTTQSSNNSSASKSPATELAGDEPASAKFKLPTWFNYNLYKQFYGKQYRNSTENELHMKIYLRTALKVFEQRALFRAGRLSSLPSINELSDLPVQELATVLARNSNRPNRTEPREQVDCCSYDQLYSKVIELLNKSANESSPSADGRLTLSRALLEELEQKSLAGGEHDDDGDGRHHHRDEDDQHNRPNQGRKLPQPPQAQPSRLSIKQADVNVAAVGDDNQQRNSPGGPHVGSVGPARQPAKQRTTIEEPTKARRVFPQMGAPVPVRPLPSATPKPDSRRRDEAAHSGPARQAPSADQELEREISENIRQQIIQQLDERSELGKQLKSQFSALYHQPVTISAKILDQSFALADNSSAAGANFNNAARQPHLGYNGRPRSEAALPASPEPARKEAGGGAGAGKSRTIDGSGNNNHDNDKRATPALAL